MSYLARSIAIENFGKGARRGGYKSIKRGFCAFCSWPVGTFAPNFGGAQSAYRYGNAQPVARFDAVSAAGTG